MDNLRRHIETEIAAAGVSEISGDLSTAFAHLERAHVLGQASTRDHTLVHWRMLKLAIRMRDAGEIWGQLFRIVGAATKTPLGIYPKGNTGGANVWFFRSMPIPDDLQKILEQK